MAWLELHRGQLITAFVVLVAVLAAIYLWRHSAAQKEAAANAALLALRPPQAEPGGIPEVVAASEYLKIAEQYPGTAAGQRARLLAAGSLFHEGRYADALAEFRRVAERAEADAIAAQAAYGIAASLEAQGNVDEAITAYRTVISQHPDESVADQARLALARIHEARSELPLALQLYDELVRTPEPGAFAQMAEQQREALLRKHPELAGTNAIPPAAVN